MVDEVTLNAIYGIIVIVAGILIGKFATDIRYTKGKKIIHAFTEAFKEVDDALYDDAVTEQEFRQIFEKAKGIWAAINS